MHGFGAPMFVEDVLRMLAPVSCLVTDRLLVRFQVVGWLFSITVACTSLPPNALGIWKVALKVGSGPLTFRHAVTSEEALTSQSVCHLRLWNVYSTGELPATCATRHWTQLNGAFGPGSRVCRVLAFVCV
jgi:hypothetical protein